MCMAASSKVTQSSASTLLSLTSAWYVVSVTYVYTLVSSGLGYRLGPESSATPFTVLTLLSHKSIIRFICKYSGSRKGPWAKTISFPS